MKKAIAKKLDLFGLEEKVVTLFKVAEDTFVRQLMRNGKNVVFIGDDTWDGLFPNQFHRSYFYPSLEGFSSQSEISERFHQ